VFVIFNLTNKEADMIYIGTTEPPGQAIYLEIHAIEQQGNQTSVSALVGDGCYEGEVLIECGEQIAITYADAWLGGVGLGDFLQRCGNQWLQQQLVATVMDRVKQPCRASGKPGRQVYPHQSPRHRVHIAETPPFWLQPA